MGNVVSIPESKMNHVTAEELEEYRAQRAGEDNLYEAGILDVPNPYNPSEASKYAKTERPDLTPGPIDATGEGQPRKVSAKVISRENNTAVDKSEVGVVRSSGRKNAAGSDK